jgi:SAM-dependent methyltransferase
MPDLRHRYTEPEMMDDLSIGGEPLTKSLEQLRLVNTYLGGCQAVFDAILPYMERNIGRTIHILDIGSGIGDIPAFLLQFTGIRRWDMDFTIVDYNPETAQTAANFLRGSLDRTVKEQVSVAVADAYHLPFKAKSFDIVMASMFLHHFPGGEARKIVAEMNRVARDGVLINDLQRNEFAYYAIQALTQILPATEMVRNDAPLSVARGFNRPELYRIGRKAGLQNIKIRWKWAFRWVMTSGRL